MRSTQSVLLGLTLAVGSGCKSRSQQIEEFCGEAYTERNNFLTGTTREILARVDAGAAEVSSLPRVRFMGACRRLSPQAARCASISYAATDRACRAYEAEISRLP